jgi:hypothetical protein
MAGVSSNPFESEKFPVSRILVLAFLLTSFPALTLGATYHVNKLGSDANSCAAAQSSAPAEAKRTITAGASCLSAGDTLLIGGGTYSESLDNPFPSGVDDGRHTIVRNDAGAHVIVDGCTKDGHVIEIRNRRYITIDGIDSSANACIHSAISIGANFNQAGEPGSHYIVVQNSILRDAKVYTCVAFRGGDFGLNSHITIRNNSIHNCGTVWPTIDGFRGHGIYPTFTDGVIEGNTIYNIGSEVAGFRSAGMGIHQYGGLRGCGGLNNIIRNNFVHDTTSQGILASCGSDVHIYNNVIYNAGAADNTAGIKVASRNTHVYNNTVYGSRVCISIGEDAVTAKNNLCWANTDNRVKVEPVAHGAVLANNLTSVDPEFVNAKAHDFRLSSLSPAIGMGVELSPAFAADRDGTPRPQGAAWDVGAYQYGRPSP